LKSSLLRIFWQLFKGYWSSAEKWRARGLFAAVIALNLASVYILVRINDWYRVFYDALQAYDWASFWPLVGEFTVLAMVNIFISCLIGSALAATIGVRELTSITQQLNLQSGEAVLMFLVSGLIYLALAFGATKLGGLLELRLASGREARA